MSSSCLMRDYSGICKPKLFAALALFYFKCRLYIKMTVFINALADIIAEQLSKFIYDSSILNLKLPLKVD